MAEHQDFVEHETGSQPEHEDTGVRILNPEQLAQENQMLREKVGVMETQMQEVMLMLQSMRAGTAAESTAATGPAGVTFSVPPPPPVIVSSAAAVLPPVIVSAAPVIGVCPPVGSSGLNHQNPPHSGRYPWGMPAGYIPRIAESTPVGSAGPTQAAATMSVGVTSGPQLHASSPYVVHSPSPGFVAHPQGTAQPAGYYYSMGSHPQGHAFEGSQPNDQIRLLEERIRAMECTGIWARDARDLCLVPDLVLPPKFKMPEMDKYRGAGCPSSHITMYVRRMGPYASDDKILIHCFQHSLAGAPLDWYMQLQSLDIRSWKDLSEAFLKQYKYNMDMAPDRSQLQHMSKGERESFKEYAQKWRSTAAQVKPALTEKEMVYIFLETLPGIYYDRLITSVSSNFSDMVVVGERLENGLRSGKIANHLSGAGSSSGSGWPKKNVSHFPRKKDGETNAISGGGSSYNPPRQTVPIPASVQNSIAPRTQNPQRVRRTSFDPIPMTYTELFNHLSSQNLINTRPMKPLQPPFPRGYNANSTCIFHANAVGHTVEDCVAFKHVVQDLIDSNWISFKQSGPSTTTNPLPGHGGPAANAVEHSGERLVRRVQDVRTPLSVIYAELCRAGVVRARCCQEDGCTVAFCQGGCENFRMILQDLMDRSVVQIGTRDAEKVDIVSTLLSSQSSSEHRNEAAEESLETAFQRLEISDAAKSKGQDLWSQKIPICHISQSFVHAGLWDPNQIAIIGEDFGAEEVDVGLVRRCSANEKLKNWDAVDIPVTCGKM